MNQEQDNRMNVLLISSMSDETMGGVSSWTKEYINYCANTSINCILVNTKFIGERNTNESMFKISDELKRNRRIKNDLKKALKSSIKIDVAHINTSCSMLGVFRDVQLANLIKKANIKIVVHFHCDVEYQIRRWKKGVRFFSLLCLRKLIKTANAIITLSSRSDNYIVSSFDRETQIIPNFINKDLIIDIYDRIMNFTCANAVFVGHVIYEKGIKELLQIADRHPEIVFSLLGEVSQDVLQEKVPGNIKFLGSLPRKAVIDKMDQSDFFIFPSHSEGFSVALLEAMARGLPVIATDVGSNRDMIENKGGFISAVGDVDKMSSDIELIKDVEVRKRMSEFNIHKVVTCYSSDTVLSQYIGVYNQ